MSSKVRKGEGRVVGSLLAAAEVRDKRVCLAPFDFDVDDCIKSAVVLMTLKTFILTHAIFPQSLFIV
jgi:hypothetical protein